MGVAAFFCDREAAKYAEYKKNQSFYCIIYRKDVLLCNMAVEMTCVQILPEVRNRPEQQEEEMIKAGIIGATGYAGAELVRLLTGQIGRAHV